MRNDTKDTTPARQPLPLRRLLPPLSTDNGNDDNNDKKNHKNRADVVRVYLIRHGQTDWNLEGRIQGGGFDIPLNETGKLQARLAAKALEGIPMDVVASSPLSRARETADILMETMLLSGSNSNSKSRRNSNNHNHLIRRIVDSGFTEMKFGALEGLRYKAITEKEDYDRFLAIKQRVVDDPDYRFPASSRVDPWEKKREHEPELEHETKTDDDDDDDASGAEKPKKKSSALRKAARTVTLLLAILLYPIIADEVGDHMVVGSSSSEPRPQSLKRSREHELVVPESDNDDQPIADTDNPIMEESGDALESEPGSSRGSDNNEAWKDKLPPLPKQRGFTMPTVSTNTGNSPNTNKNGPNYWLNDRRRMALSFISEVVEQVGPSVVRIDTESQVNKDRVGYNYNNNPLDSTFVQQGQGSGLIFSSEGFILTNAHVVEGATKVKVTLTDGRVYSCIVTGTDDIVDIAVLKIVPDGGPPITNLPVAELGDSDQLKVGKIVIAVGSPGGLDNTVTMGIVSGRERSSMMVGIPHKLVNYIQTDAAINPGNSGGPLIDVESGQVIGINAAIRAHMEGTSFAIPINRVRDIMHDLSNGKEIRHGYLGCQLTTCTPDWARENNAKADVNAPGDSSTANKIPEVYGALVHKIYGKSPVHLGGLKEQDIIQQIGSEPVKSASDASRLIDLALPGDNIPFTILRNGNAKIINVKPKDMSSTQREMQREKQRRLQDEKRRFQELGPFRSLLRD
mmetsp:Transcript_13831/g.29058  ORF Transcript_13831/g.29058 Transcript_13831/m.29058 type:complete len:740 (-) Transcript_13831:222-2441(-)